MAGRDMAKRSKSSQRWLERQRRDPYARVAREQGLGSRAHFKLAQLDERFGLLRRGMVVLELGAAPGGWTRFVEDRVDLVVAVDPLPVAAGPRTRVLTGRLGEAELDVRLDELLAELAGPGGRVLDLVMSDMAPNISGIRVADQARAMDLVELATKTAERWLKPGGGLVVKVFQGAGVDAWLGALRPRYQKVNQVKPRASRSESREVYAVARGFRGPEADPGAVS
jgi:23S rRNA (uridine2552-2'-O)-methyltransferase